MKNHLKHIYHLIGLAFWCLAMSSAAVSQSYKEVNGRMTIHAASGASTMSPQLYIGPRAVIHVIGEWRIASQQIYISPSATISGSGTIVLDHPAAYRKGTTPLSWTTQTLDGGGAAISCNVVIRNPNGVILNNITPPAALGYVADTMADLVLNNQLIFFAAMTGNDITANTSDVIFAPAASVTGYSPDHFIITNGTGSIVRRSLGSAGFIYPVGIARADYTPARILNDGVADDYRVNVVPGIVPANPDAAGIGRTWSIREAVPGGSIVTLTLQHNAVDGPGGPGTADPLYTDGNAFISGSQPAPATWDSYSLSAGTGSGLLTTGAAIANASSLSRPVLIDFTGHTRFTKFSPTPLSLIAVKSASTDSVLMGDTFSYHIRVVNTGIRPLVPPVVVVDTLPAGALYFSTSGTGVTALYAAGVVTVTYADTLLGGDSIVFDIHVAAIAEGLGNVALVYAGGGVTPTRPCDTCSPGDTTWVIGTYNPLIIPDAFSPNGDGVNDNFVIPDLSHYYPLAALSIYNRNGDEVWSSNGPYKNNFGGVNYSGQVLPVATYFYVLYYNDGSGRKTSHSLDLDR